MCTSMVKHPQANAGAATKTIPAKCWAHRGSIANRYTHFSAQKRGSLVPPSNMLNL
jgi:hypothetical protein